jgi:nicotinamide phosphoribosyltransferase
MSNKSLNTDKTDFKVTTESSLKAGFGVPVIDADNPLILTDGYKPSHWLLYPEKLEKLQSYFESRTGAKWNTTVFFGLQYILLRYFSGQVVTQERIDQADQFYSSYFGSDKIFNRAGWEYILKEHDGRLPVVIRALPEGTVVPVSTPMCVLENTDPNCAWLVNYLETVLVSAMWYPSTVATQSREIKKRIWSHVERSGGTLDHVSWMAHDFGMRGSTSVESASLGGAAHLLSFFGSDNLVGDILLRNYYGGEGLVSGSIPASEHSTVTTWGAGNEDQFIKNALKNFPQGLLANVTDSYDPKAYITEVASQFKKEILSRNGKLVFRPDSGHPPKMSVDTLNWLEQTFCPKKGASTNEQGFKILPPQIGGIYGDGMNYESIDDLYTAITKAGWAAHNFAVGSGGGLLQNLNRDTQRFAFKANWAQIDGEERDVFKKPSSDPTKNSKRGRLAVINRGGQLVTVNESQADGKDLLEVVFKYGEVVKLHTLEEIRARASI